MHILDWIHYIIIVLSITITQAMEVSPTQHVTQENYKQNSLFFACLTNDDPAITHFIGKATAKELNEQDLHGRTSLMIACYHKNITAVKKLLENGAHINLRDSNNRSAFFYASRNPKPITDVGRKTPYSYLLFSPEAFAILHIMLQYQPLFLTNSDLRIIDAYNKVNNLILYSKYHKV